MTTEAIAETNVKTMFFMLPSRNATIKVKTLMSLYAFAASASSKGYTFQIVSATASNIPRARNACMDTIRELPKNPMCLWIDDDMFLDSDNPETVDHLMRMLDYAEEHPKELVTANYRTSMISEKGMLEFQVREFRTVGMHNKEWEMPKEKGFYPLGTFGASGFGLLMGYFPKRYRFHADVLGEDIWFWNDTNQHLTVYTGLVPGHAKEIIL